MSQALHGLRTLLHGRQVVAELMRRRVVSSLRRMIAVIVLSRLFRTACLLGPALLLRMALVLAASGGLIEATRLGRRATEGLAGR